MNEQEFGGKIARLLEARSNQIDGITLARLKAARLAALERVQARQHVGGLVAAGMGSGRGQSEGGPRSWLWAPLVALLLVAAALGLWHTSNDHEGDDVDAFLLSGDLPVRAYVDQDFDAWLKASSR